MKPPPSAQMLAQVAENLLFTMMKMMTQGSATCKPNKLQHQKQKMKI
jgi:hypothetical protein